jgi:hypothetical protein
MSSELLDRQVDAYNRHDLDAFSACYSENVKVRDGQGQTLMSGIVAFRRQYDEWFTTYPDLHVEVRNRMASGTWAVDEEQVTMAGNQISGLVGYHLADGQIDAVVMLTDSP